MFMVGLATLSVLLLAGYWLSRRNDRPKARVLAVSVRQLTADGNVEFASLSADGRYFVYDSYRDSKESLWVANVAGGNPVQVQPPKNIQIRSLAFAPDGNTIFYVADGTLYRSPVTPGAAQKVLDGIVNFSISPDGRQIAVVRADSDRATSTIVISNLDGTGLPHELASLPLRNGYSPYSAWSPDGAMLAIGAVSQSKPTQMALMGVRIADGATNQLTPQLWSSIGKVAWLRDNSGLVLDATVEQSYFRIWLIDYPSGEARCITNDAAHYGRASVSISNDGASLLAVRDESSAQIWISPAADLKKAQQITSSSLGKLDGNEGLTWAPDGRIVYSSFFNDSYSLWIMNVDGSGARQLTSAGFNDQLPQVTSDGRYIVFQSDRGGGSDIWRVNLDGSDMKQLTNSGRSAWPDLTPDGKWIIYVARDAKVKTIQKISIDGGTPIRMLAADLPSVSPDGKLLAATYLDEEEKRTRLAVFLIEGGEALSHFSIPASATFNGGLRWLPDGSAVVYRDYRDGLWAQKISGGAPEKLAGLPNKKIRYFDWSSDGRQFAMSYGEEVRDVVLISNFR